MSPRWAVSVKAVVRRGDAVLLGRNDRGEWELLGGRLEPGEQPEQAVRREVREEAGLDVEPARLVLAEVFEPVPGRSVLVLAYACTPVAPGEPVASHEHGDVRFIRAADLAPLALPAVYRRAIAADGATSG